MNPIFNLVARLLDGIARITGFTYNEINIVAYYIALPFIYVALIDRILGRHILKTLYIFTWILALALIRDFTNFSDMLFQASVDFLLIFSAVGLDYVAASVVICVILPGLVLLMLSAYAFPSLTNSIRSRVGRAKTEPKAIIQNEK